MVKIYIDAGHGGQDSGAVGNGLYEKNIVLSIANELNRILLNDYEGVQTKMTRTTDVFLSLTQRTDNANAWGADAFVSIHCNSGGGWGFETFRQIGVNDAETTGLQNAIHKHVMGFYKNHGIVDRGTKSKDLHVLRESHMIACLTENLFMDNPEITKFNNADFMRSVAKAHAEGIAEYFGLKRKSTGGSNVDEKQPSDWAKDAWNWGLSKGIIDGNSHPHGTVTEEILIHMLNRAANNGVFK